MLNAAFAARGIEALYLAFEVRPMPCPRRSKPCGRWAWGGNLTIPHKRAAVPYLDRVEGEAALSGSVNTVVHRDGRLIGHSTDGKGFLRSLREETGFTPAGKSICLLGTGGAALAIALRSGAGRRGGADGGDQMPRDEGLAWPTEHVPAVANLDLRGTGGRSPALAACDS